MEGDKFQESWFSCFGAPGLHFLVFSRVLGLLELHFLVFSRVWVPPGLHFLVCSRVLGLRGSIFLCFLMFLGLRASIVRPSRGSLDILYILVSADHAFSCFLCVLGPPGLHFLVFSRVLALWGLPGCVLHVNLRGKRDSRHMCKKPNVFSVLDPRSTPGRPEPKKVH